MNYKEFGLPNGVEILRFPYRGETTDVPVAPNFLYLKRAIYQSVLPRLERLLQQQEPRQQIGVGFVNYMYQADSFDFKYPEVTQTLIQNLKRAGLPVLDEPQKLEPVAPERYDLVAEMRERGDYYYSLDDFQNDTFLIGPIIVNHIPRIPGIYDYVAECETAKLVIEASVGIHGEALLTDFALPRGRDRIFNREIVTILERVFHPHQLK